jgi:hypothetical protein
MSDEHIIPDGAVLTRNPERWPAAAIDDEIGWCPISYAFDSTPDGTLFTRKWCDLNLWDKIKGGLWTRPCADGTDRYWTLQDLKEHMFLKSLGRTPALKLFHSRLPAGKACEYCGKTACEHKLSAKKV